METLYKKAGRRYVPVGYEFEGWPSNGVWLVQDGRWNNIYKLCDLKDIPALTAIPLAALKEKAATHLVSKASAHVATKLGGRSLYDTVSDVVDFIIKEVTTSSPEKHL